jgi:beta-mannosidase
VNKEIPVSGPADTAIDLGKVPLPKWLPAVYFVRLDLKDAQGKVVSRNLYWKTDPAQGSDLSPMQYMPVVKLNGTIAREDVNGRVRLKVTLTNPDKSMALMVHLQLRDRKTNKRVLPVFYSDNYIWIGHDESRTITIDAAEADLHGDEPLVVVDGWNVDVTPVENSNCALALNEDAQVRHYPATGLPMITAGLEGKGAPPYVGKNEEGK